MRVQIEQGSIEYLIGPDLLDFEQVVDVTAVVQLDDGRSWQVRVATVEALRWMVGTWRETAGPVDVLSFTSLFVIRDAGLEAMTKAIVTAIPHL
jgi:hypothetical protein